MDSSASAKDGSSPRLRGTARHAGTREVEERFIPAPAGNGISRRCECASRSVHPRACGERQVDPRVPTVAVGSSPRLRGTALPDVFDQVESRFIPAPAGNGVSSAASTATTSVHPRACGERNNIVRSDDPADGSSPRLRGTVNHATFHTRTKRFIPAPAGNGYARRSHSPQGPVHPRACGERPPGSALC